MRQAGGLAEPPSARARLAAIGVALAFAFASSPVRAADACFSAPLQGQKLRKAGKLTEARARFAACSRRGCPAKIVEACMRWTAEVDAALPSVVLAAHDSKGGDLTDVRVAIDGGASVEVSPLAMTLDPGTHRLAFQRPAAPDVVKQVVLHEGEKGREVVAVFETAPATAPAGASAPPAPRIEPVDDSASASAEMPGDVTAESPSSDRRPVPAGAWVLGGAGAVAFVSFATFAGLGLSARANDHCATGCSPADYDDVTTKLRVADVSLAVGIVALGVVTVLYLTRTAEKTHVPAVAAAPGVLTIANFL